MVSLRCFITAICATVIAIPLMSLPTASVYMFRYYITNVKTKDMALDMMKALFLPYMIRRAP